MLEATLESEGATTFMLWGFTDKHSWIPGTFPGTGDALIFDSNYKKKPAYDSLAAALKRAQSTAVNQPVKNETLSSMTMSCNGSILKVNF